MAYLAVKASSFANCPSSIFFNSCVCVHQIRARGLAAAAAPAAAAETYRDVYEYGVGERVVVSGGGRMRVDAWAKIRVGVACCVAAAFVPYMF